MPYEEVTKYVKIDENGIAGQDARSKEWYCKEVPFKDHNDLREKITRINEVLNEFNKTAKNNAEESKKTPKKKKIPETQTKQ